MITPAGAADAGAIQSILHANRADRSLFQQPLWWLARHVSEFAVVRDAQGQIVGCAQLHWHRDDIAEILAVAVAPSVHGSGIGSTLIRWCIERARERNVRLLWLATTKPAYFARFGFRRFLRWRLPLRVILYKLWLVFHQRPLRWLPAIFGRHRFMRLTTAALEHGVRAREAFGDRQSSTDDLISSK